MGTLPTDFARVSQGDDECLNGLQASGNEPRVAVHSLGCKLNYSEGDTISRQFTSKGYRLVDFDTPAEVYVINTCSVTDHADRKCKNLVQQSRRLSPRARVVVTGCFAQLQPGAVAQIPGVDLVVGGADKFRILQKLERTRKSDGQSGAAQRDKRAAVPTGKGHTGTENPREWGEIVTGEGHTGTEKPRDWEEIVTGKGHTGTEKSREWEENEPGKRQPGAAQRPSGVSVNAESTAEIVHRATEELTTFEPSWSQGNRTRSFLKVQDGCDYSCTFCTIPGARGASRSGQPAELLRQARALVASGVREIVLTGVNTGDYGWVGGDLQRGPTRPLGNFGDLLELLADESGVERLRVSSIEPNLLTDRMVNLMATHERIMPHVHMPLQSGSDGLLARMKRRYRSAAYADRVRAVKSAMPHACIGVDVIVGFPGETDGIFMETHDFVAELEVSYLHVFTYSERPGTAAAGMNGRVPNGRRSDRNRLLTHLGHKKRVDFAAAHRGTVRPVLFEQEKKGTVMQGYTDNYLRISAPYDSTRVNRIVMTELSVVLPDGTMESVVNALK